jgi:type II secretory pathway pseudopilin PulG
MTRMLRSNPNPDRSLGFTLIEMVFVMCLIGLLGVMSAGRISTYIQERNVAAAVAIVRNDLQQAFAIAARNRQPVRISFATADTALHVANRANTVTYINRDFGRESGFMLTPSNVTFCASTCSGASVDVFPNGWASDTLTVTITKGSYSRGLRMSRSGLVTTR